MATHDESGLNKNQSVVLDVLARAGRPLSAYQILDQTSASGVRAPQQVYRALERLLAEHLVHRIESLNAYLICQASRDAHAAAFAICKHCGAAREFPLEAILPALRDAAAAAGFRMSGAHVEISGACAACPPPVQN